MPSRESAGESATYSELITSVMARLCDDLASQELELRTDKSPEVICQMKLGCRRLSVALSVFEPQLSQRHADDARSALKNLSRALGKTYEWDAPLQLLRQAHQNTASDSTRATVEHLLRSLEKRRERARRKMTKAVQRIDFSRLLKVTARSMRHLSAGESDVTMQDLAWQALEPRIARVVASLPGDPTDVELLWQARAIAQKLRFTLELLQPAFLSANPQLMKRATDLEQGLTRCAKQSALENHLVRAQTDLADHGYTTLATGVTQLLGVLRGERSALFTTIRTLHAGIEAGDFHRLFMPGGAARPLPAVRPRKRHSGTNTEASPGTAPP
ncbi:MAG: CHAD domain-containing protein [Planctomycetota bacterium]